MIMTQEVNRKGATMRDINTLLDFVRTHKEELEAAGEIIPSLHQKITPKEEKVKRPGTSDKCEINIVKLSKDTGERSLTIVEKILRPTHMKKRDRKMREEFKIEALQLQFWNEIGIAAPLFLGYEKPGKRYNALVMSHIPGIEASTLLMKIGRELTMKGMELATQEHERTPESQDAVDNLRDDIIAQEEYRNRIVIGMLGIVEQLSYEGTDRYLRPQTPLDRDIQNYLRNAIRNSDNYMVLMRRAILGMEIWSIAKETRRDDKFDPDVIKDLRKDSLDFIVNSEKYGVTHENRKRRNRVRDGLSALSELPSFLADPKYMMYVHGDEYAHNFMVRPNGEEKVYVLDAGSVHIGRLDVSKSKVLSPLTFMRSDAKVNPEDIAVRDASFDRSLNKDHEYAKRFGLPEDNRHYNELVADFKLATVYTTLMALGYAALDRFTNPRFHPPTRGFYDPEELVPRLYNYLKFALREVRDDSEAAKKMGKAEKALDLIETYDF